MFDAPRDNRQRLPDTFYTEVVDTVTILVLCLKVEPDEVSRDIGLIAIHLARIELNRNVRAMKTPSVMPAALLELRELVQNPTPTWSHDLVDQVRKIINLDTGQLEDQETTLLLASL